MNFGIIPLAAQFAISVASWMVKSRVGAAAAAQMAAAEFEQFKRLSDGELTEITFEMARQFPVYPYWEWFRIMQDLRDYGYFTPGAQPDQAAGQLPDIPAEKKPEKKSENAWIYVGAGILVLLLLTRW